MVPTYFSLFAWMGWFSWAGLPSGYSEKIEFKNFHFWPTTITKNDPDVTGSLYGWPEFEIILHTKGKDLTYSPAFIDEVLAEELSSVFTPETKSVIKVFYNKQKGMFGLTVPGGGGLRSENLQLLDSMERFYCVFGLTRCE